MLKWISVSRRGLSYPETVIVRIVTHMRMREKSEFELEHPIAAYIAMWAVLFLAHRVVS